MPTLRGSNTVGDAAGKGGTALIVGAGVAGLRAALDLAEAGYGVALVDASSAVGGLLAQLDHQFPTDHCGMCQLLPVVDREAASQFCLRKGFFHERIQIFASTTVTAIQGEPGAFQVSLRSQPQRVDPERCGCDAKCIDVCPVQVPDPFNRGLTQRKAIYRPTPFSPANIYYIDTEACTGCGKCVDVCPGNAIDLGAQPRQHNLSVDVITFATGTGLYDPAADPEMQRYLCSANVLTAPQFERLLSPVVSSRSQGLRRPSDGKPIKRIAWLQCVGSRDPKRGRDFCSSICCMMALKEAVLARIQGGEETETTIFYMDLRAYGKDFYRYRLRAEQQYGVRLIRCRVHQLQRFAGGDLRVRYFDPTEGKNAYAIFDMVVLSTGQARQPGRRNLTDLLGSDPSLAEPLSAERNEKTRSVKPGIILCGTMLGLSDIAESVVSGSAAASEASKLMHALGRRPASVYAAQPQGLPVTEEPRLAVMLCTSASSSLSSSFDALSRQFKQALQQHSGVAAVYLIEDPCSDRGAQTVREQLQQSGANRLLVVAALPYTDQARLLNQARDAGLNPALVRLFDLYGPLLSIPAKAEPELLVRRLMPKLAMVLEQLKAAQFLPERQLTVIQRALVIGAGPAGMRVALSLADRDIDVALVERTDRLGGWVARKSPSTLQGVDPGEMIDRMVKRVEEHRKITLYYGAQIEKSRGTLGNMQTVLRTADNAEKRLSHGVAVVATGGSEATTTQYNYAENERILTQAELEQRLASGEVSPGEIGVVVMIQCVESLDKEGRQYCSRICCINALKNALQIKRANPEVHIVILKREVMTYGEWERFYTEARRIGIRFDDYRPQQPPRVVIENQRPVISYIDQVLARPVQVNADLLVLSTGVLPDRSNAELARIFGLELTDDGFFQEAQSKWRPVDASREGFFLAGMAHSPQTLDETLTQAEACAQRAFTILSRRTIALPHAVSSVRHAICAQCQTCITVCPYHARALDQNELRIVVDPSSCRACGLCAAACPNGAAEILGLGDKQVMNMINTALE